MKKLRLKLNRSCSESKLVQQTLISSLYDEERKQQVQGQYHYDKQKQSHHYKKSSSSCSFTGLATDDKSQSSSNLAVVDFVMVDVDARKVNSTSNRKRKKSLFVCSSPQCESVPSKATTTEKESCCPILSEIMNQRLNNHDGIEIKTKRKHAGGGPGWKDRLFLLRKISAFPGQELLGSCRDLTRGLYVLEEESLSQISGNTSVSYTEEDEDECDIFIIDGRYVHV